MSSSMLLTCANPEDRFTAQKESVDIPEMDLGSCSCPLELENKDQLGREGSFWFPIRARYARLSSSGQASLP